MRIFFEDTFDSAHWLPNVPIDHKCHNLHGHTYKVRIEIEGDVGKNTGWIVDYAEIKNLWEPVKSRLDHHCLNEIIGLENSTCEHLAFWIWTCLLPESERPWRISRLEIRETEHCGAIME